NGMSRFYATPRSMFEDQGEQHDRKAILQSPPLRECPIGSGATCQRRDDPQVSSPIGAVSQSAWLLSSALGEGETGSSVPGRAGLKWELAKGQLFRDAWCRRSPWSGVHRSADDG